MCIFIYKDAHWGLSTDAIHWLPVRQRAVFKVATLVYQSLCGHAPGYLVDDCQLVTDVRARKLRSADT